MIRNTTRKYIQIAIIMAVSSMIIVTSCASSNTRKKRVRAGIEHTNLYIKKLVGKKVGIFCNQTATFPNKTHLVDSLCSLGIDIQIIFAPEHGFRGDQDAGAHIHNTIDTKTGIPIVSLYGAKKTPSKEDLEKIDVFIFDIQDVGVRFYTYISSLELAMKACAQNQKPFILLDRPNPNAHYIDGPILEKKFKSFVGMQSIPIAYGMTIGEYGKMLLGEAWLQEDKSPQVLDLTVVACTNYTHQTSYKLPIAPSPNLKNHQAILLYPSLAFFEGTPVSVGRGTPFPYEVFGHPTFSPPKYPFMFVPKPNRGNKNPIYNGQKVFGLKPKKNPSKNHLELDFLLQAYKNYTAKEAFFTNEGKREIIFFDKLAGTDKLRMQIKKGESAKAIRASWQKDIATFKHIRKKYLIYP